MISRHSGKGIFYRNCLVNSIGRGMRSIPLKAVFFDMDGVIIDSMPYHFLSWYECLRPYGVRVSCLDVYLREGENWEKSLRDFLRHDGVVPRKRLLKEIFAARYKIFRRIFKPFVFDGAFELLARIKSEGALLGLVTGTIRKDMERILPKAVKRMFDCLITGDMVRHGKPSPEPYLLALKELGFSSGECLVVENAPLGIKSARNAGIPCLAVSTSLPKEYLKEADLVADDLGQVLSLLIPNSGRHKM